jgi:hypothetical protein
MPSYFGSKPVPERPSQCNSSTRTVTALDAETIRPVGLEMLRCSRRLGLLTFARLFLIVFMRTRLHCGQHGMGEPFSLDWLQPWPPRALPRRPSWKATREVAPRSPGSARPAEPHQLRDATRVIAVGLVERRLESVAHAVRFQQFDREPGLAGRRKKATATAARPPARSAPVPIPTRQATESAPRDLSLAAAIDNADAGVCQRHVRFRH